MTTMEKKNINYVSEAEYRRNKRAAQTQKNVRRNRTILAIVVAIIVLVATFKFGGWVNKITSRQLTVDHYETYIVRADDTLSGIASRFKMPGDKDYRFEMSMIMKENGISNENQIRHGQELRVPIYHYELIDDGQ